MNMKNFRFVSFDLYLDMLNNLEYGTYGDLILKGAQKCWNR